jgi:hypothetical protein
MVLELLRRLLKPYLLMLAPSCVDCVYRFCSRLRRSGCMALYGGVLACSRQFRDGDSVVTRVPEGGKELDTRDNHSPDAAVSLSDEDAEN